MKLDKQDPRVADPATSPSLIDAVSHYEATRNRGFSPERAFRSAAQFLATEDSITLERAATLLRIEIAKRTRDRQLRAVSPAHESEDKT